MSSTRLWTNVFEEGEGTPSMGRTGGASQPSLRFISYRLLPSEELKAMTHVCVDAVELHELVVAEVLGLDADVLGLQGVDNQDIWRSRLENCGYEVLFLSSTHEKRVSASGVIIAFRRAMYQLFLSVPVPLNEAASLLPPDASSSDRAAIITDNVGLIAFLQPWGHNLMHSALCVGCMGIDEDLQSDFCRGVITQYFTSRIEQANCIHHLPVLIATALGAEPTSRAYQLLRTGRTPITALPPRRVPVPPQCERVSRCTANVRWMKPHVDPSEPILLGYRLAWRPGGSASLGFAFERDVSAGDCAKDEGDDDRLCCHLSGLASDVPYQFRVLAYNEVGPGAWSDVSIPLTLLNPSKGPNLPPLVLLLSESELCAKLTSERPSDDLLLVYTTNSLISSASDLVERNIGRVLPISINPRTGWHMHGEKETKHVTIGRKKEARRAIDLHESKIYSVESVVLDGREVLSHLGADHVRQVHHLGLRSAYEESSVYGEPLVTSLTPTSLACLDYVFYSEAAILPRRLLALPRIAALCQGGDDARVATCITDELGRIPPPSYACMFNKGADLEGMSFEESKAKLKQQLSKSNESLDEFWGGTWEPLVKANPKRENVFLPNHVYGSSHLALCVDFVLNDECVSSVWNNESVGLPLDASIRY